MLKISLENVNILPFNFKNTFPSLSPLIKMPK